VHGAGRPVLRHVGEAVHGTFTDVGGVTKSVSGIYTYHAPWRAPATGYRRLL